MRDNSNFDPSENMHHGAFQVFQTFMTGCVTHGRAISLELHNKVFSKRLTHLFSKLNLTEAHRKAWYCPFVRNNKHSFVPQLHGAPQPVHSINTAPPTASEL